MDVLEIAKAEQKRLKSELEKSQTYKRLMAIESVIAAYLGVQPPHAVAGARTEGKVTKASRIETLTKECIREKGGYASVADIHSYIGMHGVEVTRISLSSYLSGFKDLKADRTRGWSILESKEEHTA